MTKVSRTSLSDTLWSTAVAEDEDDIEAVGEMVVYGREKEKRVLLKAFSEVLEKQSSETVVIHGALGTGKTSLAESLRKEVCNNEGYFCSGKYSQNSELQEPHSAIMAAFSDVCDLVMQSNDYDEKRRSEIQQALGSDGRLLAKAITSLSPILPNTNWGVAISSRNEAACAKFKAACKTFLRTMSSIQHPIVLFLDDVQWMDEGSKELLDSFHTDKELSNVLLILSYRDGDASSLEGMSLMDKRTGSVHIKLSNLNAKAVNEMISVGLGCKSECVSKLSDVIFRRTLGNPFHLTQLIDLLGRDELLRYDSVSSAWIFDVDEIDEAMITDVTVADILSRKVRYLDTAAIETLKIAAFLGFGFDETILAEVSCTLAEELKNRSQSPSGERRIQDFSMQVAQSLVDAVGEGFIENTNIGFQFRHDVLQSHFSSMLEERDKEGLRKVVGLTYLTIGGVASMYHAATHLNRSSGYVIDQQQCHKLAFINFAASKYCEEKCAFKEAARLLRQGLSLINSRTKWTEQFELAFEMTEALARLELILGNIELCQQLTREALLRGKSTEMKTDCLMIDVEVAFVQKQRMSLNEDDNSFETADRALKILGISIPRKVGSRHVMVKLLTLRRLLALKKDKDILSLPAMTDRLKATAVQVLFHVYSYSVLRDHDVRSIYAALVAAELTLRWGTSPFCACAFALYGIAELSVGRHKRAFRFGKLALKMQEQLRCRDAECAAVTLSHSMLMHWERPIRDMRGPITDAFRCGYQTGDKLYCFYAATLCFGFGFFLGDNLPKLEDYMHLTYQQISGLGQADFFLLWLKPAYQFVLNMQNQEVSCWRDLTMLTGDIMNEQEYMYVVVGARNTLMMMIAWVYKSMLAYYFGFYSMAESIYNDMDSISQVYRYNYSVVPYYQFGALIFYERFRETRQRKHMRQARKYKKLLLQIKRMGSPNVSAYLTLLDAVEASLQNPTIAILFSTFNRAIDAMAAEEWPHMEALANELAGFAFVEKNALFEAEGYFERSLELYQTNWGAHAKYQCLREKSKQALAGWRTQSSSQKSRKLLSDIIEVSCEDASHEI